MSFVDYDLGRPTATHLHPPPGGGWTHRRVGRRVQVDNAVGRSLYSANRYAGWLRTCFTYEDIGQTYAQRD